MDKLRVYADRFAHLEEWSHIAQIANEKLEVSSKVSNHVFAEFEVNPDTHIYCQVGLGIFVEMTPQEARKHSEKRKHELMDLADITEQQQAQRLAESQARGDRLNERNSKIEAIKS